MSERWAGRGWHNHTKENAWVQGLFQDLISAAEEHDFNERFFTNSKAITEGHIITQAIKVMLNTVIHHYYGAEAYSKHPSGSVRGQREEETC